MTDHLNELPAEADVVIVGAGPHAAALVMRLLLDPAHWGKDPNPPLDGFRKHPAKVRQHLRRPKRNPAWQHSLPKIVVIDKDGDWMLRWQKQFKAFEIQHLRSPEGLHPDPFEHQSLAVWAKMSGKEDSGFKYLDAMPKCHLYKGPFRLPNTDLFADFCKHLFSSFGMEAFKIYKGYATSLVAKSEENVEVLVEGLEDKCSASTIMAKHVIVARGPSSRRAWPQFREAMTSHEAKLLVHAWDLIDDNTSSGLAPDQCVAGSPSISAVLKDDTVIIIGGGLTSAHLCAAAARQGCADIHLFIRRDFKVKQFDLLLPWMGYNRWKSRADFEKMKFSERREVLLKAREGGSITPEMALILKDLHACHKLVIHENEEVISAKLVSSSPESPDSEFVTESCAACDGVNASRFTWQIITSEGAELLANHVWCATGSTVNIQSDPLLKSIVASHPIDHVAGLPCLSNSLQWGSLPIFFMGNMAALQLGPDAVNLAGALRGATRIAPELLASLCKMHKPKATSF